jgi:hypothetical protein
MAIEDQIDTAKAAGQPTTDLDARLTAAQGKVPRRSAIWARRCCGARRSAACC